LAEHVWCVVCAREKRVEPSTVIDHITPHRGDVELFWDMANWQAICKRCHDKKTARGE
jgi:5-methylcytosine-specific restriction protein A